MPANYPLHVVLTAIDRVTAPLQRINQRLARINEPFKRINNSFRALTVEAGVPRLAGAFGNVFTAAQRVNQEVKSLLGTVSKLAIAGAGLIYLFKRQFIDTADQFERLNISLEAIEGSAEKAKDAMTFLKKLTLNTPFQLQDIAQVYRTMRGYGMDPTNGSLQAIIDQVAKLGGSGEDLLGIAIQLGQAFGKQKLLAQDMRPLIERGVPVWQLLQHAAERMGKKIPIKELQKMGEEGKLGLGAWKALVEQMGIESEGAAQKMMVSWSGMFSNLKDRWTFFKIAVMNSGPFDNLKKKLQGILETIDRMAADGSLDALAELWGQKISDGIETAWQISLKLWKGFKDFKRVFWPIALRFGRFVDRMGGGKAVAIALAAILGIKLVAAVVALGGALAGLNAALLGTPVGLLLLGGAALIGTIAAIAGKSADPNGPRGRANFRNRRMPLPLPGDTSGDGPDHRRPVRGSVGSVEVTIRHENAPPGAQVRSVGRGNVLLRHQRGLLMPESAR